MNQYNGHYNYDHGTVNGWQNNAIGIYYCGEITTNGNLTVHYVGKGTGDGGIRARLLDHIRQDNWPDVRHFGYVLCSTAQEAINLEAAEIRRLQPKYNTQGL